MQSALKPVIDELERNGLRLAPLEKIYKKTLYNTAIYEWQKIIDSVECG